MINAIQIYTKPMLLNVSRAIYFNVLLLMGLTDWLLQYFEPEKNVGNWIAAAAGAFVIRFAYPNLPVKVSLGGFVVGFILACLYAPTAVDAGTFGALKPAGVWGTLGLIGDGFIQLIGWAIRYVTKVGEYAVEHPGEAFDSGLDRVEKVVSVWVRIKSGALDLLNTILNKRDS